MKEMKTLKPKITHQVLYAKNFYAHSGDIIVDMRKVCKLDMPTYDFYSPKQILKFMRKQYYLWLDQTPSVKKSKDEKLGVQWEKDPIKSEIWSILISYSCFIPMTTNKGFIGGLPNYNVLKPQYNAELENIQRKPFKKTMTPNELGEKAGEILSMTNTEIMDIMADNLMKDFKFDMASKILECFGKQASQKELDNELWEAYSYAVEDNLQDGQLNESYFEVCTKHFDLSFSSKQECNCSMNAYVQLVPMRWVYESDVEVTESNYKDEVERCLAELYALAEKDANKIVEIVSDKFGGNKESCVWDAPKHLMNVEGVCESMFSVTKEYPKRWWEDNYKEFAEFGPYNAMGSSSGCFSSHIQNNEGKVKVILSFGTEYTSESYSNSLYNREAMYINSKKE